MQDKENDYLKKAAVLLIISAVLGFFLKYVFNIALARTLEPSHFGNYKIAESFIGLTTLVVLLGGGAATFRFLTGSKHEFQAIAWEYLRFYGKTVFFVSFLLMLGVIGYYIWLEGEERHPLAWAVLVVPLSAYSYLLACLLHARRHVGYASLPWEVGGPILCLVLVGFFWFFFPQLLTAELAIGILGVAMLVIVAYEFYLTQKLGLVPLKSNPERSTGRTWLRASIPMMLVAALSSLLLQVDLYMIEAIDKHENCVGYFAAASTTVGFLLVVALIGTDMFEPLMGDATAAGKDAIRALNRKGVKTLMVMGIPVALLITFFSHPLLMLFGEDNAQAHSSLLVLIIGYLFATITALPLSWLQYSGSARTVAWILAFAVLTNVILNYLLIPRMHIVGAAVGTSAALILSNLAMIVLMRKRLGVWAIS